MKAKKMLVLGLVTVVAISVSVFSTGCIGTTNFMPPKTPITAHWTAPVSTECGDGITLGSKVGRSTNYSYFSLVSSGDCSVVAAAKSVGITKIRYIEHEYKNVGFFMYQEMTVIVYGD